MLYDILFDRLIGYYGIEHHQYQKKKKSKEQGPQAAKVESRLIGSMQGRELNMLLEHHESPRHMANGKLCSLHIFSCRLIKKKEIPKKQKENREKATLGKLDL